MSGYTGIPATGNGLYRISSFVVSRQRRLVLDTIAARGEVFAGVVIDRTRRPSRYRRHTAGDCWTDVKELASTVDMSDSQSSDASRGAPCVDWRGVLGELFDKGGWTRGIPASVR